MIKTDSESERNKELEARKKIEAVLFSSGRGMTTAEIAKLTRESEDAIKKEVEALRKEFDEKGSSLMIVQDGELYKMSVREKYIPHIRKIVPKTELSKTVLETLAVIAWKTPILQSEVIKIRTNKAYDHIDQLEEAGFVSKKKQGRTFLIALTQKFYEYFELSGRADLQRAFKRVEERAEQPQKRKIEKIVKGLEVYESEKREETEKPRERSLKSEETTGYIEIEKAEEQRERAPEVKLVVEKKDVEKNETAEEGAEEERAEEREGKETEEERGERDKKKNREKEKAAEEMESAFEESEENEEESGERESEENEEKSRWLDRSEDLEGEDGEEKGAIDELFSEDESAEEKEGGDKNSEKDKNRKNLDDDENPEKEKKPEWNLKEDEEEEKEEGNEMEEENEEIKGNEEDEEEREF